jgi:hypothetical protein
MEPPEPARLVSCGAFVERVHIPVPRHDAQSDRRPATDGESLG